MAEKDLIIDDEYCTSMGNYFYTQGQTLNTMVKDYITALEKVRRNAIKAGEAAEALDAYIDTRKNWTDKSKRFQRLPRSRQQIF